MASKEGEFDIWVNKTTKFCRFAPRRKKVLIKIIRFVGFLTGASLTGFSAYYYLVDEYRTANTVVVGDVVALKGAVERLEGHVKTLESRLEKK